MDLYLHCPNTPSWRGAQLKHRDNFIFLNFFNTFLNILICQNEEECQVLTYLLTYFLLYGAGHYLKS